MHVKRTATIVLAGGALAAWLAGATTSNRALPDPIVPRRTPIDSRGADLAVEIARLREHLTPASTPRAPGRNVFRYHAAPVAAPTALRPAVPAAAAALAVPRPSSLLPLKLSGIAEDQSPDGPVRVAIISSDTQLYLVKIGELVTPRYRVTQITADVVELQDLEDHSTRRLALR